MTFRLLATVSILSIMLSLPALARGGHHGSYKSHATHASHKSNKAHKSVGTSKKHNSRAIAGVKRDKHGRIARSSKAKNEFKKTHRCPATGKSGGSCPGYVIDHIKPLKRGGADRPSNMQWQTKEQAKTKDKWE